MEHAGDYDADADMQDMGEHYGEDGQTGSGPYYDMPNIDPSLSDLLDDNMANINLEGTNGNSLSPLYRRIEGKRFTPSKKGKAARAKDGKKKQVVEPVQDEDPAGEEDEAEGEDEEEDEGEDEDDDDSSEPENENDHDFTLEPKVAKKTRSVKRKIATPKSSKGAPKAYPSVASSGRKPKSTKVKEALPFNRQRRAPRKIIDSRPIPRSYQECDEADKMLIDMREEGKYWKDIRVAWEELTNQETGASTLPNRYE